MADKLATWRIRLGGPMAGETVTVEAFGYNSSGSLLEFMGAQGVVLAVPESCVGMIERVDAETVEDTPDSDKPLHEFATAMNDVFARDQARHPIRQRPHQ